MTDIKPEHCNLCGKTQHPADDEFESARATCPKPHDPHPMVTTSINMAQVSFGARKLFRPRPNFCHEEDHYRPAALVEPEPPAIAGGSQ